MAFVIGGEATRGMNFDVGMEIGLLSEGTISQKGATYFRIAVDTDLPWRWYNNDLWGSFVYNDAGQLIDGVITRWHAFSGPDNFFDVRDFSAPVPAFLSWIERNDNATALRTILAGADSIVGTSYGDLVRGYEGADTISGGGGGDLIDGGAGTSYLRGDDGADTLTGGADFDDINGNVGNDSAAGGGGADWVVGGKDNDRLLGEDGDDIVYGNLGVDTCEGSNGADIVRGGQDDDLVLGQAGNDWLSGDRGSDTVTGGTGADTFHTSSEAGLDRVTDFNRAEGDRVMVDPGTTYTVAQSGADTVITMSGGQMVLVGVQASSLSGDWIFGA